MRGPRPSPSRLRRLHHQLAAAALVLTAAGGPTEAQTCNRIVRADVVAFDQVFFWNRLGAVQPQGMMYALRRDVMPISGTTLSPGNIQLRPDKRPRPIVLRMNAGDCIRIQFQNLLSPTRTDQQQPATRQASIHAVGMQLVDGIPDDGSWVGTNLTGLVNVGQSITYTLYAQREGEHLLFSAGATNGGEGDGGSTPPGLFGAIIVEPPGARWYRSQVTRADLDLATTGTSAHGQRILDYEARYPVGHPKAGTPILNMLDGSNIVHTDLTAIIAGSPPNEGGDGAGWFPPGTFPPNIYTHPQREQPFREFVIIYHDEIGAVQAFPVFEDRVLSHTLHSGRDAFAINYGTGGIGAEIFANRIGVGPMHDCNECKYEEFFLTSWVVGDPAMIVDVPASSPCTIAQLRSGTGCTPTPGPKATKAFYPDDPSNVYHGYLNDHTRFRVLHAGPKEHHIHHLHAHQWLFTADSDESIHLPGQPGDRPRRFIHRGDRLQRGGQPEPDGGRLDLSLPFLSPFRPGHVVPLAGPRRVREGDDPQLRGPARGGREPGSPGRRDRPRHTHSGPGPVAGHPDGAAAHGHRRHRQRPGAGLEPRGPDRQSRLPVFRPRHRRPPAAPPAARHDRRRRPAAARGLGRHLRRGAHPSRLA